MTDVQLNYLLWHSAGSAGVVLLAYAGLTAEPHLRGRFDFLTRLVLSAAFSFLIGLVLEILSVLHVWPWCPCIFDGWGLFVNVDSILATVLTIVLVKVTYFAKGSPWDSERCAETIALSADGMEKDLEFGDDDGCSSSTQPEDAVSEAQPVVDFLPGRQLEAEIGSHRRGV
jgi:hypothetical protein